MFNVLKTMERVHVKMPLKHIVVILCILIVNSVNTEICDVPLNTSRCSDDIISLVYTYSTEQNVCVKALWFGCPSDNMFLDISTCELNCNEIWDDKTTPINNNKIHKTSTDHQNLLENIDATKKANDAAKIVTDSDKKIDTPKTGDQSMKKVSTDKKKLKKVDAPKKEPKFEKNVGILPKIDKTGAGAPKKGATKKNYIHAQTELIRKLRRANRKLDSRTEYEYIDLMLRDEYVTPTGNMLEFQ